MYIKSVKWEFKRAVSAVKRTHIYWDKLCKYKNMIFQHYSNNVINIIMPAQMNT